MGAKGHPFERDAFLAVFESMPETSYTQVEQPALRNRHGFIDENFYSAASAASALANAIAWVARPPGRLS